MRLFASPLCPLPLFLLAPLRAEVFFLPPELRRLLLPIINNNKCTMTIRDDDKSQDGVDTNNALSKRKETCPLTGQALPDSDLDVARVNSTIVPSSRGCGHACSLVPLVASLQEPGAKCPSCKTEFVVSICDNSSFEVLLGEKKEIAAGGVVAFAYGSQNYWLAVPEGETAQARVARVLGKDLDDDLKILHKGKLIFPDKSQSEQEISDIILKLSYKEAIQTKKKPSLIVMGARAGRKGAQAGRPRK